MTKAKSTHKARTALALVAAGLCVLLLLASYYIGLQCFASSVNLTSPEETAGAQNSGLAELGFDYEEFCDKYRIEHMKLISSVESHEIPVDYILSPSAGNSYNVDTVVLSHGIGDNRFSSYPVAELFLELGYNVICYDQRNTNENTAPYNTYGYLESHDLIDCVVLAQSYAPTRSIGIWGSSMGGSAALFAAADTEAQRKLDFLILDSPVSSMSGFIEREVESMELSIPTAYVMLWGNIVNRLKLGFGYEQADGAAAAGMIEIPTFIIHSAEDTVTPPFMAEEILSGIAGGNKSLWTSPAGEHALLWRDSPTEYRVHIEQFIESIGEGTL